MNGAGAGLSAAVLQNGLNAIYAPAVVSWSVELAPNFATDARFDNLESGNSSAMAAYTDAQRQLVKAYRDAGNKLEDGSCYIFVVRSLSNGDAGYMVRGGQTGFVSSSDVRTFAHELGHGAFKLPHTWDAYGLPKGSTDNLMDYGGGTELWYGQWRYMRNPDVIFRPLQGDDKGAEAQSPECKSKLNLLTSLIKSETIGINFLKLLAAEEQPNQKSSDGKYTTRTYSENGVKIIFYENGWPDEIDHLFKVELSGQSAKDAGLNSFWLYFNPNAITTENIPVVLALKDTMPLPGEKAYCYLPMDNFPRGISAGAAFSDMVGQQVFLTAEIVSTGGILRAGRFASGAAIDLGLQLAMLDIIKTSLGEHFTTTDLLAEVSWTSVMYSGLTYNKKIPVVVNILGSFTVGFADALAKEAFREKSAKNLNLVQASYEGFKQALITAGIEAVLRLVKIPARYSRKQVEDAFEDAGKGVQGLGRLFSKLDKLGLIALKTEINLLDDVAKAKFLDEFADASDDALRAMNGNNSLLSYWKTNGSFIKNKSYPNVGHKLWDETKNAIITKADPTETKILNAIENAPPPSNSEVALAAAYSPELGGNVVLKYNENSFNVSLLEPELKQHLDYLAMIKADADAGGKLYEKLYSNVPFEKLRNASVPGRHAEVLAVNEVIKQLKQAGKFNIIQDLNKIYVLVKGRPTFGNMCRCPHCFQIIDGVKMIGNQ